MSEPRPVNGSVPAVRPTWKDSDRFVPRAFVRPALRFTQVEAAGGIVMLVAALAALVWANSPWHESYERFLSTPFDLSFGSLVQLELDLHAVVNDGLMTLFFLLAGLEIKRQLVTGELRDRRAAALPAIAALGGMLVPALIYAAAQRRPPGRERLGHPGGHGHRLRGRRRDAGRIPRAARRRASSSSRWPWWTTSAASS